jgi:zinc protease
MAPDTQSVVRARLDNGLEVLLKEVHTAPTASCSLWYRVGSRNEKPGRTGLSHWVEHLQFKGTPTYPAGVPDRLIAQTGGTWNASTWLEWTEYQATLPAAQIDLILKLESDRMAKSIFDHRSVESERTVIIAERQGLENSPYFRLSERVQKATFDTHPYRYQVIGELDDLQHISRQDLVEYYQRYYVPSNAVLAVAGHFNAAELLDSIEKLFGSIPAKVQPIDATPVEPPLDQERRIFVQGPGETEIVEIAYRAPSATHPDFLPMAILDSILAGASSLYLVGGVLPNRTSRLYQSLVEGDLAASVGGNLSATIDPYLYRLGLTVRSDRTAEEALAALDDEIARLVDSPISQAELDKAIKQAQALLAYGSETSSRLAFAAGYAAIFPEIDWLQDPLARLSQVTVDQVLEAARTYLLTAHRVVGFYKPTSAEPVEG